jgi:hypothetical protein
MLPDPQNQGGSRRPGYAARKRLGQGADAGVLTKMSKIPVREDRKEITVISNGTVRWRTADTIKE